MTSSLNEPLRPTKMALLFAAALLVRACAMVALGTWGFDPSDNHWAAGWETGRIASHLANGNGFSMELGEGWTGLAPTAWLAPLYPSIVAAVFAVLGSFSPVSIILVLLFQAACDGGTCVQLTRIGGRLGHGRAGLLAGILFALSPEAINMSIRVLWCTSFLTFLCVTLVVRMLDHARTPAATTPKSCVATGTLIGLTLLTSPAPALFVGLSSLLLIAKDPARNLRAVTTMAFVATLVVAPWIVRNNGELGSVFFLKSNIGNELFIGNNPIANGEYQRARDTAITVLTDDEFQVLELLNELERAEALGAHSVAWIGEHPAHFGRLTLRRIWIYWTFPFLDRWEILPLGPFQKVIPMLYDVARWLVLLSALVGGVLLIRTRENAAILLAYLAMFPVAYYLTHAGVARYRFPVVPGVYFLAAITFHAALAWRRAASNPTGGTGQASAPVLSDQGA